MTDYVANHPWPFKPVITDYTDPATVDVNAVRMSIDDAFKTSGDKWDETSTWPSITVKALADRITELEAQISPYPIEILNPDTDNGTMVDSLQALTDGVVGRKIMAAEKRDIKDDWRTVNNLVLTLDNGTEVQIAGGSDCCAYTEVEAFLLDPASVDHAITGVGTTDEYTVWHIFADMGDVMKLDVGWSCGNPFYYGYGFDINVVPIEQPKDFT